MRAIALGLLAACGVFQIGMGLWFIIVRPPMLPEDQTFTGMRLEALNRQAPAFPIWLDWVFTVLGGHAMSSGILAVLAACLLWNRRVELVAVLLLAAAGVASAMLMSGVNFAIDSDFRWLLLLPALTWLTAVLLLAASCFSAKAGACRDSSPPTERTSS
jgi:hypothetical protein